MQVRPGPTTRPADTESRQMPFSTDPAPSTQTMDWITRLIGIDTTSRESNKPLIDAVVDVVGKCPGLKIEVSGHTDSDGADGYNQQLSERRAQSVMKAVVRGGVPAEQLTAVGYGETKPVAPNDTWKNKALNRRIEFTVVN